MKGGLYNIGVYVMLLLWFNISCIENQEHLSLKPIKCIASNKKAVALTFDDGLKPEIHKQILDLAKKEAIPVTFFLIGNSIDKNDLLKRTITDGHEIGNHSMTHSVLPKLSNDSLKAEIIDFQKMLKRDYNYIPKLFRAPKLQYDNRVMQVLKETALTPVNATVGTKDYAKDTTKEYIYNAAVGAAKKCNGCIILMHEVQKTVDVLPQIIKYYRDNDFEFLTVSQLISIKENKELNND